MKTLIVSLAIFALSLTTLPAKDGEFKSMIIPDNGADVRISLASKEWMKITNFTQNDTGSSPARSAGVAVFNGTDGMWVLFATNPTAFTPHEDMFIAGPATVVVVPQPGAIVFMTYQRGSD
ncbi:MAG TPA: hypothetical protein VJU77_18385 [Chthoniobacterales bacterium]|nr:hypothetical protein [Chthoniobacterales bacterium]